MISEFGPDRAKSEILKLAISQSEFCENSFKFSWNDLLVPPGVPKLLVKNHSTPGTLQRDGLKVSVRLHNMELFPSVGPREIGKALRMKAGSYSYVQMHQ